MNQEIPCYKVIISNNLTALQQTVSQRQCFNIPHMVQKVAHRLLSLTLYDCQQRINRTVDIVADDTESVLLSRFNVINLEQINSADRKFLHNMTWSYLVSKNDLYLLGREICIVGTLLAVCLVGSQT